MSRFSYHYVLLKVVDVTQTNIHNCCVRTVEAVAIDSNGESKIRAVTVSVANFSLIFMFYHHDRQMTLQNVSLIRLLLVTKGGAVG